MSRICRISQDFTGLGLWCAGAVVAYHGVFDASASIIVVNRDTLVNPASDDLHGEGQALALRSAARFFTVARGPVPRDRTIRAKNARQPGPFSFPIEARRGTGPRPTVKGGTLANRSAGALACHTRRREGFPRERRHRASNLPVDFQDIALHPPDNENLPATDPKASLTQRFLVYP